jgi:phosphate transport system substrate-binding protein
MERKIMIAIGVVAVIIVAAVGAAIVLNSNSSPATPNAKVLTIQKNESSPAFSPLDANAVYNKSYALSRDLYLYTDGVPTADSAIGKWLSYIYSTDGQAKVNDAGFYPVIGDDLQAMKTKLTTPTEGANNIAGDFKESGSTTLGELSILWSTQFEQKTGIKVTIDQPGSGGGITNFINGAADVAQASRAMTAAERTTAEGKGINVTEWKVAVDGLALIVNKGNPVDSLTIDQLKGIYNGSITNWNQVGGNDQTIVLYGREETSGSYASFKDLVLGSNDDYADTMIKEPSNAAIIPEVESNAGGIGYVGVGYAKEASGTAAHVGMTSFLIGADRLEL